MEPTKSVNWINVNDRLPEFDKRVLLHEEVKEEWKDNNYGIVIGYLNTVETRKDHTSYEFLGDENRARVEATHWMPLPEPPKN